VNRARTARAVEWTAFAAVACLLTATTAWAQWGPDVRLTYDTAASWSTWNNAWGVAASGDTVHVAWTDGRDLGNDSLQVYYKRSLDGGMTWGPDQRLSGRCGRGKEAVIAVSGPRVYVAWAETRSDDEVYFRRSTDAGTTWGPEACLTSEAWECGAVSMAASESLVHVVWWGHGDGWDACYYRRSTNSGTSWDTVVTLPDFKAFTFDPSVAVDRQFVHVAWPLVTTDRGIYYRRSTDRGSTWSVPRRIVADSGSAEGGSIAASDSLVHFVWRDDYGHPGVHFKLYYARSTDAGATWQHETALVDDTSHARNPSIAASGPRVHVVWWSDRTGKRCLYYKRSTDRGLTWSPDTCLTDSTGNVQEPSVAVSGAAVHVVWNDQRDGNREIYYKDNPSGNAGVAEDDRPGAVGRPVPLIATVARGELYLPEAQSTEGTRTCLFDIFGRTVARLHPGCNDVSGLSPGIYFIRRGPATVGKVVVQK